MFFSNIFGIISAAWAGTIRRGASCLTYAIAGVSPRVSPPRDDTKRTSTSYLRLLQNYKSKSEQSNRRDIKNCIDDPQQQRTKETDMLVDPREGLIIPPHPTANHHMILDPTIPWQKLLLNLWSWHLMWVRFVILQNLTTKGHGQFYNPSGSHHKNEVINVY